MSVSVCGSSAAAQTLDSIAKCNREDNQSLKDITETTKGSEGGREQRPSTNKTPDVKEIVIAKKI